MDGVLGNVGYIKPRMMVVMVVQWGWLYAGSPVNPKIPLQSTSTYIQNFQVWVADYHFDLVRRKRMHCSFDVERFFLLCKSTEYSLWTAAGLRNARDILAAPSCFMGLHIFCAPLSTHSHPLPP